MKREGWDRSSEWYDKLVGKEGHYYHQQLILPGVVKILKERKVKSLLDLGCGQGVLARVLPKGVSYFGVDVSPRLIKAAKEKSERGAEFAVHDLSEPVKLPKNDFDSAAIILALQDMDESTQVLQNAALHLKEKGVLVIVLNHPCYRIPRQSSWSIDQKSMMQSRQVNCYMSPLNIPIKMAPGKNASETVVHHHMPLSEYASQLREAGFVIETIEEWVSDKKSTGRAAKMENRARKEFPLFLCLVCRKCTF